MKNMFRNSLIFALFTFAALILGAAKPVYAASADISISVAETRYEIGEVIPVIVSIEAEVIPGEFQAYINYNSEVIEYLEGPACVGGGVGTLRINDVAPEGDRNSRKYVLYFAAVGRGKTDLTLGRDPELYEYESGYLMSVSSNSASLEVTAGLGASSDADLSSLKISPGSLTPAFSADILEYSTRVDYEVTRLIVSAKTSDEKASVEVTGAESLLEGQNRIVIRVTAEDGTEKKYVLYAVRSRAAENTGGETITLTPSPAQEPAVLTENKTGITAVSEEGRVVLYSSSRYTVVSAGEGTLETPGGYKKTSIILDGISIAAYVPEDEPDSDFLLLLLCREGGEPGFYTYDRAEKTLQRYTSGQKNVIMPSAATETAETADYRGLTESYEKSLGSLTVAVMILCAVCALLLIIVLRLFIKSRGIKNDELD